MKKDVLLRYLTEFLSEQEMTLDKFVLTIKTHILCSITFFFSKIMPFMR